MTLINAISRPRPVGVSPVALPFLIFYTAGETPASPVFPCPLFPIFPWYSLCILSVWSALLYGNSTGIARELYGNCTGRSAD